MSAIKTLSDKPTFLFVSVLFAQNTELVMRHLLTILIFCGVTATAADFPPDEDRIRITETLGPDWIATVRGSSIEITSTFEVFHVGIISRITPSPEFNDSISRAILLKEAKPERYVIRLEYGAPLSSEETQQRIKERQRFADILNYGAHGKNDWGKAAEGFLKIRVPRYRGIYRILPDHPGTQIYPPSAVAKIGAAKELLDVIFRHIRNAYE